MNELKMNVTFLKRFLLRFFTFYESMKKKFKKFYRFRLILPIKIYYFPDFENV